MAQHCTALHYTTHLDNTINSEMKACIVATKGTVCHLVCLKISHVCYIYCAFFLPICLLSAIPTMLFLLSFSCLSFLLHFPLIFLPLVCQLHCVFLLPFCFLSVISTALSSYLSSSYLSPLLRFLICLLPVILNALSSCFSFSCL